MSITITYHVPEINISGTLKELGERLPRGEYKATCKDSQHSCERDGILITDGKLAIFRFLS